MLLGYLLFGSVAADWCLRGDTTKGYGLSLLGGALLLSLLFALGFFVAKKHRTFLQFALWQWVTLTSIGLASGVAVRVYMF
jgi:hypothetical protein